MSENICRHCLKLSADILPHGVVDTLVLVRRGKDDPSHESKLLQLPADAGSASISAANSTYAWVRLERRRNPFRSPPIAGYIRTTIWLQDSPGAVGAISLHIIL